MAFEVFLEGGVVDFFLLAKACEESRAESLAAVDGEYRAEGHVQHLAGVEVFQLVGQLLVGKVRRGGHFGQLGRYVVCRPVGLVPAAGEVEKPEASLAASSVSRKVYVRAMAGREE